MPAGDGGESDDDSEAPDTARSAISRESPPVSTAGIWAAACCELCWAAAQACPRKSCKQLAWGGGVHPAGPALHTYPCASPSTCALVPALFYPPLPPAPQAKLPQLRDDLKAGWLEKRSGDSSSLNALPLDSWKWQRRWFVLAMESGFLYYFKSPEQMSTPGLSPKVVTIVPERDRTQHPARARVPALPCCPRAPPAWHPAAVRLAPAAAGSPCGMCRQRRCVGS